LIAQHKGFKDEFTPGFKFSKLEKEENKRESYDEINILFVSTLTCSLSSMKSWKKGLQFFLAENVISIVC